jgi:hypothetical protein
MSTDVSDPSSGGEQATAAAVRGEPPGTQLAESVAYVRLGRLAAHDEPGSDSPAATQFHYPKTFRSLSRSYAS